MGGLERLPADDRTLHLRPSRTPECPQIPFRDTVTLETIVTFSKRKNHRSLQDINRRVVCGGEYNLNASCFAGTQLQLVGGLWGRQTPFTQMTLVF